MQICFLFFTKSISPYNLHYMISLLKSLCDKNEPLLTGSLPLCQNAGFALAKRLVLLQPHAIGL